MRIIKWVTFYIAVLASLPVQAQTYYITDKVLVGVYAEANADSNLLTTLPTGTPLEVISRNGSFVNVRSPNGSTGWIENSYMIEHKPAQLVVLELTDKQKQADEQLTLAQAELRAMQEKVSKLQKQSENADQSDEIASLTKQRKDLGEQLDNVRNQLNEEKKKSAAVEKTFADLQQQIASLKKGAPADSKAALPEFNAETKRLQAENHELIETLNRVREALALPAAPAPGVVDNGGLQIKMNWLWISIVLLFLVGFIAGMKWLDWRNLQRHGGFRI